ncbi:MAG: hypothetical protein EXR09_06720 [Acetobacteraceae bacterium]|nr:hypothetical protein [Acetobacteraceae bacterium]
MVAFLPDDLIVWNSTGAVSPETRTGAPPATCGRTVRSGPIGIRGADLGVLLRDDADPTPCS